MANIGLILAGGEASRLGGVSKPELRVGGLRIVDRVARVLSPHVQRMLVATGQLDAIAVDDKNITFIRDIDNEPRGPFAGLIAAIAWIEGSGIERGTLVVAAGDTPLLPPDFVPRLEQQLGSANAAAVAGYGGQAYFTNSLWRIERLSGLVARHRSGSAPRSLKRLAEELGAIEVAWPDSLSGDPFANANTAEELEELRRRAAGDEAETAHLNGRH